MSASYEDYYGTGTYDRRYPGPNRHTLGALLQMLGDNEFDHIVDFGSGNGRYLLPLLAATGLTATAIEPSMVARTQLIERAEKAEVRHLIEAVSAINNAGLSAKNILAMALFGVLSHIVDRCDRMRTLSELRALIEPNGQLVISVPNRWRRFYRQQLLNFGRADIAPGAIRYQRRLGGNQGHFVYQLYTARSLRRDLKEAGFVVVSTCCESVLPERTVTSSVLASRFDGRLARTLPAPIGYGLMTICRPV